MFADDKRAAGLGPSAHEASDFMPTRESLSDNEQLLPGGYADDHWRNEHKRVADEKAAREEAERIRQEKEDIEKAAEEKRKKEEAERLHRESLPVSIWKENGGPLAGGAAEADITKKTYTENEFVMNFLQQKNRMKMELPAQFNRGL
jgi:hypothetical protein